MACVPPDETTVGSTARAGMLMVSSCITMVSDVEMSVTLITNVRSFSSAIRVAVACNTARVEA